MKLALSLILSFVFLLWIVASVVGMVYEITLNGETLRMEKEVYSNVGVPQIGESRTLYIDENDLGSYIEPIADKSARMIGYYFNTVYDSRYYYIGAVNAMIFKI